MHSKADMTTRHVRLVVQKYNNQFYSKKHNSNIQKGRIL